METRPREAPGRMVETDIGRLHVESAGSGPAILLWPTLFFGSLSLRAQFEVCARDHRVLLVDPPGHGHSDSPRRRFSPDDCAQAALRVLDDAGLERAIFLGTSYGGPVSVAAALRSPGRVRGLILLNAPMHAFSPWQVLQNRLFVRSYETLGPRPFLLRALLARQVTPEFQADHPERVEAFAAALRSADRAGMALAIRSVLVHPSSLVSRLPELRVPTLFIAGACDRIIEVEVSRAQAKAIPGSRFEVVEGAGHQCGYEVPERTNSLIGEFLSTAISA